jgi:hypothetical protein
MWGWCVVLCCVMLYDCIMCGLCCKLSAAESCRNDATLSSSTLDWYYILRVHIIIVYWYMFCYMVMMVVSDDYMCLYVLVYACT